MEKVAYVKQLFLLYFLKVLTSKGIWGILKKRAYFYTLACAIRRKNNECKKEKGWNREKF
jgi:hypothetical protein